MKHTLTIIALSTVLTACGSNTAKVNDAPRPQINLPPGSVQVAMTVPYAENGNIPLNVKQECTNLGSNFSNSIVKYANEYNVAMEQVQDLTPTNHQGALVEAEITSVYSSGNAFIGHSKSATIQAKLYINGKLVDTFNATRNSGGGFMGGFKGSCAVLYHTVNTLGNDVAKWLTNQS